MAIEDFEWRGEIPERALSSEAAPPSRDKSRQRWWRRLKESVWLEPGLRLLGVFAGLTALSGIGIVATTYAKPGLELPAASAPLAAALGTSWLKPSAEVSARSGHDRELAASASGPKTSASAAATAPPAPQSTAVAEEQGQPSRGSGITADGKVILNLASAEELRKLPGVGPKRAEAIVALRTKLKRFRAVTDLLRVKGIGPKGLKKMLPHLVLDAPALPSSS
jgi:competence protein ComEA